MNGFPRTIAAILALGIFAAASPALAQAQDTAPCDASQFDLFKSIGGSWTFKQGAGSGVGAIVPFPLPAHKPQAIKLEIDPRSTIAYMKHDGQRMAMIPVPDDFAKIVDFRLTPKEKQEIFPERGACGWESMPTIVGAMTYNLVDPGDDTELIIMNFGTASMMRCRNQHGVTQVQSYKPGSMNKDFKFYYGAKGEYFEIDPTPDGSSDDDLKNRREYFCPKGKPVKVGDMTMTLLLKFTSANSATGYLDFRGSTEASKPLGSLPFVARAPVTLTR